MKDLAFWVVAVLGPVVVILVTTAARHSHRVPHTAASELWGLLVVFHLTMIVQSTEFANVVGTISARVLLIVGGVGLLISCIMWMVRLTKLEPMLVRIHRS
jgi:predicted membrane channel-forming protein YqfA (hemolysin III family)